MLKHLAKLIKIIVDPGYAHDNSSKGRSHRVRFFCLPVAEQYPYNIPVCGAIRLVQNRT